MRYCFILVTFVLAICCHSQPNFTLATGFSINGYKKKGSDATFNHIPVSLQWSPFGFKNIFLVKLDYFIPFQTSAFDQAYTANTNLPSEIQVQKTYRANMYNLSAGARIPVHRYKDNYNFYVDALLGFVSHQNIKVRYDDYDKGNYEILNQDFSLRKTSISLSIGAVYKYTLPNRDHLLFMFHLQSPLLASDNIHGYDLSYTFVTPLQLMFGYNLVYNKKISIK
ncbi:MAG: hypothetical protein QM764_06875 [Chitinophagaceae bacterium]